MIKQLFNIAVLAIFIYMLASPWLNQQTEQSDDTEVVSVVTAPAPEKPLHNVVLPDFKQIPDVATRKSAFFNLLKPYVLAENARWLEMREIVDLALTELELGYDIPDYQLKQLSLIFREVKIDDPVSEQSLQEALNRVDGLPIEMVLTQAANESGWGTSRFARIGLNFFGQWCFKKGCGMVPNKRNVGSQHEVAAFNSLEQMIASYFRNINTHPAYRELRDLRQSNRGQESFKLAQSLLIGLQRYSERGHEYIDELNQMMKTNKRYFSE